MPEGYTHVRTAERGAKLAKIPISDHAAFGCGANGPDMLFCYRIWRKTKNRGENLPAIGGQLHDENTGVFLQSLIRNAKSEVQKEYVLGFLSHYAADCTVHPYIVMLSSDGNPYDRAGGHGYSEIAIDSYLHEQDTGRKTGVSVNENTPKMTEAARHEAAKLLQQGIKDALSLEVSEQALFDTFAHTRRMRRWFRSPFKILYGFFWLAEPFFGGRSFVTCHITPAHLIGTGNDGRKLPLPWKHPFTGEMQNDDLAALLIRAEKLSADYMQAALDYWNGKRSFESVAELLGSCSYLSGLPDERSAPQMFR